MDIGHLTSQPLPIPYHAYAAFLAVLIGGWQLFAAKGTLRHKYLGYIWVSLMLFVSVSSFWIHTIGHIGPFSVIHLIALFTIWSVYRAIKAARSRNIKKHKQVMRQLYALALILTGAFTFLPGRVMHGVLFN